MRTALVSPLLLLASALQFTKKVKRVGHQILPVDRHCINAGCVSAELTPHLISKGFLPFSQQGCWEAALCLHCDRSMRSSVTSPTRSELCRSHLPPPSSNSREVLYVGHGGFTGGDVTFESANHNELDLSRCQEHHVTTSEKETSRARLSRQSTYIETETVGKSSSARETASESEAEKSVERIYFLSAEWAIIPPARRVKSGPSNVVLHTDMRQQGLRRASVLKHFRLRREFEKAFGEKWAPTCDAHFAIQDLNFRSDRMLALRANYVIPLGVNTTANALALDLHKAGRPSKTSSWQADFTACIQITCQRQQGAGSLQNADHYSAHELEED